MHIFRSILSAGLSGLALCTAVSLSLFTPLTAETTSSDTTELVERLSKLEEVTRTIQREYVQLISREKIWNGAIRGMVEGLDSWSTYMTHDEVVLYTKLNSGQGNGFGFDWRYSTENKYVEIIRVIPGSPAYDAGFVAGDIIIQLNDHDLSVTTRAQARELFNMSEESITLEVIQADKQHMTETLKRRDMIDNGVSTGRMLTDSIGLIAVTRFRGRMQTDKKTTMTITAQAFRDELDRLSDQGMRALILDLRGNGGGNLLAATEVADCFLNESHNGDTIIVEQLNRNSGREHPVYIAHSSNTYPNWPIVILTDHNTASSAEILAAALQDHKRATLIGETTTGKDSVQELFVLEKGDAILLTIAHYRTPAGRILGGTGVTPDISIPQDPLIHLHISQRERLRAAGQPLPAHLRTISDPTIHYAQAMLTGTLIHMNE